MVWHSFPWSLQGPPYRAGTPRVRLAACVAFLLSAARPWAGLAWLGLAGSLAWVWLAFLRIWLDWAEFRVDLVFGLHLLGFLMDSA